MSISHIPALRAIWNSNNSRGATESTVVQGGELLPRTPWCTVEEHTLHHNLGGCPLECLLPHGAQAESNPCPGPCAWHLYTLPTVGVSVQRPGRIRLPDWTAALLMHYGGSAKEETMVHRGRCSPVKNLSLKKRMDV